MLIYLAGASQVYVAARSAQLTIYGYTADTTSYAGNKATITFNQNAAAAGSNDASGTLRVSATNFKMYNVNVINSCKYSLGVCQQPVAARGWGAILSLALITNTSSRY